MSLKQAIAVAMKAEIEGRELYRVVAEKTDDGKAREVFTYLSEEENRHFEYLKKMHDSLGEGKRLDIPVLKKIVSFDDAESPIFSREFRSRIKEKHFEMSALSIALRMERDSSEYYKKMAQESSDEQLRSFFTKLAEWENEHYGALHREMEFLEQEYFEENRFSPFL